MPKKKKHIRNFGIEDPKKIPKLQQNHEEIYLYLYQYIRSGMGWYSKFSSQRTNYEERNCEIGDIFKYIDIYIDLYRFI